MSDEHQDREEGHWSDAEEAEVEAHRDVDELADDAEDDEVEAHKWGTHGPEDPGRLFF